MQVSEAQEEVRAVYLNGAIGQFVSAAIWLASAALASAASVRTAILALVFGGMLIFPITQLVLRARGGRYELAAANPLRHLAMQIAFTVPMTLPVAGAAALYNVAWFYPACAVIVGAHYLPFVFLYGMWQYALLSGALVTGGIAYAFLLPHAFAPAGWFTGAALALYGAWMALLPGPRRSESGHHAGLP